jgi:hypothetical protein
MGVFTYDYDISFPGLLREEHIFSNNPNNISNLNPAKKDDLEDWYTIFRFKIIDGRPIISSRFYPYQLNVSARNNNYSSGEWWYGEKIDAPTLKQLDELKAHPAILRDQAIFGSVWQIPDGTGTIPPTYDASYNLSGNSAKISTNPSYFRSTEYSDQDFYSYRPGNDLSKLPTNAYLDPAYDVISKNYYVASRSYTKKDINKVTILIRRILNKNSPHSTGGNTIVGRIEYVPPAATGFDPMYSESPLQYVREGWAEKRGYGYHRIRIGRNKWRREGTSDSNQIIWAAGTTEADQLGLLTSEYYYVTLQDSVLEFDKSRYLSKIGTTTKTVEERGSIRSTSLEDISYDPPIEYATSMRSLNYTFTIDAAQHWKYPDAYFNYDFYRGRNPYGFSWWTSKLDESNTATYETSAITNADAAGAMWTSNIANSDNYAWFRTPPAVPPPYNPKHVYSYIFPRSASDPKWDDLSASSVVVVENTPIPNLTYKATLYGNFVFSDLDFKDEKGLPNDLYFPGDRPTRAGFSLKRKGAPDYTTIDYIAVSGLETKPFTEYVISKNPDTIGIDFQYDVPNLPPYTAYEYRVWVENLDGIRSYANSIGRIVGDLSIFISDNSDQTGTTDMGELYDLIMPDVNVTKFVDPAKSTDGFWYQIFNGWELENPTIQSIQNGLENTIYPLFKVKSYPNGGNKDQNTRHPLHRYFNRTFEQEKNYQFRLVAENYFVGKGNSIDYKMNQAKLAIILPWGEKIEIEPPYVPMTKNEYTNNTNKEITRHNLYVYSNINAFSQYNLSTYDNISTLPIIPDKPISRIESKTNPQNPITIIANSLFNGTTTNLYFSAANSTPGISDIKITDLDWIIQGYAPFNILKHTPGTTIESYKPNTGTGSQVILYDSQYDYVIGKGWHYFENEREFLWFDRLRPFATYQPDVNRNMPIGGNVNDYFADKEQSIKYLQNNFIAKYVPSQTYNMSFDYVNESPFDINVYVGSQLPYIKSNTEWYITDIEDLIKSGVVTNMARLGISNNGIGGTQSCEFIGLEGKQYVFFVADNIVKLYEDVPGQPGEYRANTNNMSGGSQIVNQSLTSGIQMTNGKVGFGTYSMIKLSNFKFSDTYNKGNNAVYNANTSDYRIDQNQYPVLKSASFTSKVGTGNNVVANSANTSVSISSKIGNGTFLKGTWENGIWNNGWREDKTIREFYSIGNYYSNAEKKIWWITIYGKTGLGSYFSEGDKISVSNIVAYDNNEERKLLNSTPLYVTSVDDSSIEFEVYIGFDIKRFEMDSEEHRILVSKNIWLNGVFLNGYFKGIWNYGLFSGYPMITKMDESHWLDGVFNGGHFTAKKKYLIFDSTDIKDYDNVPRVSLKFISDHNLTVGDTISVTHSTSSLGRTTILDVIDEKTIVTGYSWDPKYKDIKNGIVYTTISTGLIQNFDFYSINVSRFTSLRSLRSEQVFSYNSWIDVNYSNQSAINIGSTINLTDSDSDKIYSNNNLYGYPTNDVLRSNSVFRDSWGSSLKKYKLGKKYTVYADYVGDVSAFEDFFSSTDTEKGKADFGEQGWGYTTRSNKYDYFYAATQSGNEYQYIIDSVSTNILAFYVDSKYVNLTSVGDTIEISGPTEYFTPSTQFVTPYRVFESNNTTATITEISTIGTTALIKTDLKSDPNGNDGFSGPENWKWSIDDDQNRLRRYAFRIGVAQENSIVFSRTEEPKLPDAKYKGKELKVIAKGRGGLLNLIPSYDISNRENGTEKNTLSRYRYTMVEFDLIDRKSASPTYSSTIIDEYGMESPSLNFNNLNYITKSIKNSNGGYVDKTFRTSYLPINKNINHLVTNGTKKQEFFFNKRNLMMNFTGFGLYGSYEAEYYLDNIKLYELDMVPFFQYFKSPKGTNPGNINTSVQLPYRGTAPTLSYYTEELIDNDPNSDVNTNFNNMLITSNVEIPNKINWEEDYTLYRPQED